MRQATSVSRDTLLSLGTCFGKFTKSGKFRLHITALDYISQYAKVCTYDCTCMLSGFSSINRFLSSWAGYNVVDRRLPPLQSLCRIVTSSSERWSGSQSAWRTERTTISLYNYTSQQEEMALSCLAATNCVRWR